MLDLLTNLLGRAGFLPHGYCFTWSPGLLWSTVGADAVIAASYYSIPLVMLSYARRRPDVRFHWLLLLFSAFIFACGTTHAMGIWTVWQPDYRIDALVKLITAALSLATAVVLWPLLPRALKIPSAAEQQAVIDTLDAEVRLRRAAQASLGDVEQSLAITLASIGAGFIATDVGGRVGRMNAVAERITGWSQAEAVGRSLWEVFEREDRPTRYLDLNAVQVMLDQHITVDVADHVNCIARDGGSTAVELRSSLLRGAGGELRGLALVMRDLTDAMRAQGESSRLAAIVESSYDAIIGKTLDGRITSWNRAATALFGYTAEEIIGQPVQRLIPHDRQHEEMRILSSLARGERVAPFETVRLTRNGRPIEVSVTISPVRDAAGRIVGASKIARDASMQRRAAEANAMARALEAENRQIQEANRLKSEFLANMSHELRTPLNAIIGFADLLQAGKVPPDSPKHAVFVDHIGSSGRHLLQLINDVLDLSKVESGTFEFFPEPVALGTLCGEVLNVLHRQSVDKTIAVEVEIDPQVESLVIDPRRLKQVLFNFLSNALKFTSTGGRVSVRARPESAALWRLEVEDSGIGIRPEDLGRLFVEFQQLESGLAKSHAGTGLGLALTRKLVEAQGGSVGVRSQPGVGTVFHALLPRRPGKAAAPRPAVDLDAGPRRVLVIEDRPRDGGSFAAALERAGFDVDWATTAAEALALSRERRFAAITLDLLLPDRPGLELLDDIRAAEINRHTPVLVLSVQSPPLPPAAFSVADVFSKPLDGAAVVRALERSGVAAREHGVVLVVVDDPRARELMTGLLTTAGYGASAHAGAHEALSAIDAAAPAAAIVDLAMPAPGGFELIAALRALPRWRELPTFVWTGRELGPADHRRLCGHVGEAVNTHGEVDVDGLLGHIRERLDHA